VGKSLSIIDTLRAFACVQRSLRLALAVGDPERVALAVSIVACHASNEAKTRRIEALITTATAAAELADSAIAHAWVAAARQFRAFFARSDWPATIEEGSEALRLFREAGFGRSWETDTVLLYRTFGRLYRGDLRALASEVSEQVRSAARSGNRFLEVTFRTAFRLRHLVLDDAEAARADLEGALADWSADQRAFQAQHWLALCGRCEIALYTDDPQSAERTLDDNRRALARSLLLRVARVRCEYHHLQGRAALARAARAGEPADKQQLCKLAGKAARKLARDRIPLGDLFARLLRAGVAHLDGTAEQTVAELRAAIARLDETETNLYAAAARRQLGQTLGNAEGQALIDKADTWMREQGVVRPDRLTAMLVPGWPHPDAARLRSRC